MSIQKADNNRSLSSVIKQEISTGTAPDQADKALIQAGRSLSAEMAEVTEKSVEVREQIVNEGLEKQNENRAHEPEKGETKRSDQASLSEKSLQYRLSGEMLQELLPPWTLEQIQELWESFLNWQPDPNASLTEKIKILALLYQQLLEAVMSNTSGLEQTVQVNRLNEALQTVLTRLMESDVANLTLLLDKYGSGDDSTLKLSIFKAVTGRSPEPGEFKRFFSGKTLIPGKTFVSGKALIFGKTGSALSQPSRTGRTQGTSQSGTGYHAREAGMRDYGQDVINRGSIYKIGDKGSIVEDSRFGAERTSQDSSVKRSFSGQGGQHVSRQPGSIWQGKAGGRAADTHFLSKTLDQKLYSVSDMEKTERFASHIERQGNLFEAQGLDGKSEELSGVLASVMDIKTQIFTARSGIGVPMKTTVRSAMDQMIDHYVFRAREQGGQPAAGLQTQTRPQPFSQKVVYQVYHYIMGLYQTGKEPQDAVSRGLQYAYSQFREKQMDESYKNTARYQDQAGFFREYVPKVNQQQRDAALLEWKAGKRVFNDDWKNFVKILGREGRHIPTELLARGLWAVTPVRRIGSAKRSMDRWLIFGGVAGTVLLSAVVWWLN